MIKRLLTDARSSSLMLESGLLMLESGLLMLDAPAFWMRMNATRHLIAWTIILCSGDRGNIPEKEENDVKKQQNMASNITTKCVHFNKINMKKRKEKK
jgi:hypothetical protein